VRTLAADPQRLEDAINLGDAILESASSDEAWKRAGMSPLGLRRELADYRLRAARSPNVELDTRRMYLEKARSDYKILVANRKDPEDAKGLEFAESILRQLP
jgi:hypothetical protein